MKDVQANDAQVKDAQVKEWKCRCCKEPFDEIDLICFREWHESFYLCGETFICPDCLDKIDRMDTEDQIIDLLNIS